MNAYNVGIRIRTYRFNLALILHIPDANPPNIISCPANVNVILPNGSCLATNVTLEEPVFEDGCNQTLNINASHSSSVDLRVGTHEISEPPHRES